VAELARTCGVTVDVIVNHVSARAGPFLDWLAKGSASEFDGRFLTFGGAFPEGNAVTVLDTHDGIGVIDVGPDAADRSRAGLLTPAQIDALVEAMHEACGGTSRQATGAAASNLDLYQVRGTFYDALAGDDARYLLARALQFWTPGIPQVYYVGLLGAPTTWSCSRPRGWDATSTATGTPPRRSPKRSGGRSCACSCGRSASATAIPPSTASSRRPAPGNGSL
jgi:hypothetical protein